MGRMKKSYEQAENKCQETNYQGHLANYKGTGDLWIKDFLDGHMRQQWENKIWIGAQLVNREGMAQRKSPHYMRCSDFFFFSLEQLTSAVTVHFL